MKVFPPSVVACKSYPAHPKVTRFPLLHAPKAYRLSQGLTLGSTVSLMLHARVIPLIPKFDGSLICYMPQKRIAHPKVLPLSPRFLLCYMLEFSRSSQGYTVPSTTCPKSVPLIPRFDPWIHGFFHVACESYPAHPTVRRFPLQLHVPEAYRLSQGLTLGSAVSSVTR
jgi:hypothetical protein